MPNQTTTGYTMSPAGIFVNNAGVPAAGGAAFPTLWAFAHYDFAVQGGAIGPINLIGSAAIPAKSLIIGGYLRVTTALASGGSATAALKVAGANDLVAATAFDGAPWSSTGTKAVIPVWTAATAIHLASAADITLTIAAAALTGGAFDAYLAYIPVND